MQFYKMHGLGNDYVLIDVRKGIERDWSEVARALCDRHFGVGADGILLVADSSNADYHMRMFNPDGSEAEMCGNGIRCFSRYVYEHDYRPDAEPGSPGGSRRGGAFYVETMAGNQHVVVHPGNGRAERVTVRMGQPRLKPADIPVELTGDAVVDYPLVVNGHQFLVTALSMGNPHAVAFLDEDLEELPLEQIGPLVEHHRLFPRRVNFEIARVLSRNDVQMRVWERGAGLTLACGTGACAVAVAARIKGLVDDRLTVRLPGGNLELEWDGRGEVLMTGPAEYVFVGEWLGQT